MIDELGMRTKECTIFTVAITNRSINIVGHIAICKPEYDRRRSDKVEVDYVLPKKGNDAMMQLFSKQHFG